MTDPYETCPICGKVPTGRPPAQVVIDNKRAYCSWCWGPIAISTSVVPFPFQSLYGGNNRNRTPSHQMWSTWEARLRGRLRRKTDISAVAPRSGTPENENRTVKFLSGDW